MYRWIREMAAQTGTTWNVAVLAAFALANTGGLCCFSPHHRFDVRDRVLSAAELRSVEQAASQWDTACELACGRQLEWSISELDSCELIRDPAYDPSVDSGDTGLASLPGGSVSCSGLVVEYHCR